MPTYAYEAMDNTGLEVKDTVEANSEQEAQAKIREKGFFVTKIAFRGGCSGDADGKSRFAPRLSSVPSPRNPHNRSVISFSFATRSDQTVESTCEMALHG